MFFIGPPQQFFLIIICFSSSSINAKRNSEVCPTFFTCVWFFRSDLGLIIKWYSPPYIYQGKCPFQALTNQILSYVCSFTRVLHYLFVNILPYSNVCTCQEKMSYCIPRKCKPYWQLSWLDEFTTNTIANFFFHERLKIPEALRPGCVGK